MADAYQMGFGLIPLLESRIPGVDPYSIEGKALAASWPGIDDIARSLGVTPIGEFGDDDSDDEPHASDLPWFDPADGHRTVTALLDALDSDAELLPDSGFVRYDLEDIRNVLSAAVERQVRFRFSMLG
ncbi:MAG: hypothetical protein Aurels2KO_43770 [Aureliella sp.]